MQTNLQVVAAAKERPVITAQGRETVWSESRTDPVEEKEMEFLSHRWGRAKSYFLLSSGGDGKNTNQRPAVAVVDESLSSGGGHLSPSSLSLIITLMNEAITARLIVSSSSPTQPEEVRDVAAVGIAPPHPPRLCRGDSRKPERGTGSGEDSSWLLPLFISCC